LRRFSPRGFQPGEWAICWGPFGPRARRISRCCSAVCWRMPRRSNHHCRRV